MWLGALILPGLGLLIFAVLVYVTAVWVFDGTKPEEDVILADPKTDRGDAKPSRRPTIRRS